jgi:hypothetical protein
MAKEDNLWKQKKNEKKNLKGNGKFNDEDLIKMSCRKHNNANKSSEVQGDGDLMWGIT